MADRESRTVEERFLSLESFTRARAAMGHPSRIAKIEAGHVEFDQGLVGRRSVKLERGQASRDFLVRTDRAVYTGGDTMTLTVLGGGREPVFVDLIKDGQTLVLGGIYVIDKSERQSHVPYLHKIPLLGALFRNDEVSDSRKELLVFVTPTIIVPEEDDV